MRQRLDAGAALWSNGKRPLRQKMEERAFEMTAAA
jgi:hypothetical protein